MDKEGHTGHFVPPIPLTSFSAKNGFWVMAPELRDAGLLDIGQLFIGHWKGSDIFFSKTSNKYRKKNSWLQPPPIKI